MDAERQAVILAGGLGTRLRAEMGRLPKALAEVGGLPLLAHQLNLLKAHQFDEAVLLVNHGAAEIDSWLATNPPPLPTRLIDDGTPRGTAGAVLAALKTLAPEFLVMYADTLLAVNLSRFLSWHHLEPATAASLFVHPNDHPFDSDLVELDDHDRILCFHHCPHSTNTWLPNLVNAALYVVRRDALLPWEGMPPPLDFAKNLFPRMLDAGLLLRGYRSPEYIKDAGTIERLAKVRQAWINGATRLERKRRAIFIDRDGTLCRDDGHVTSAGSLELYAFVGPALRRLNERDWLSIIVSNQPVLARGETTHDEMRRIHARLDTELAKDHAYLDSVYICPHHPDSGFVGEIKALKVVCDCRKPAPGLIMRACRDLDLNLVESWFIGDSTADLGAAENAGVTAILVETGSGGLDGKHPYEAGITVRDFGAAVDFVLDVYPRLAEEVTPILERMAAGDDWFVGGLARSGKSTLAATLVRELRRRGRVARVVQLDRWIRSKADRERGVFGRFDMAALETIIAQARRRVGGAVEINLPAYDRRNYRSVKDALRQVLRPGEIVIWEGVVAVELARRVGSIAESVQIEADEDDRRVRFARYQARRGIRPEASAAIFAARERDEHEPIRAIGAKAAFQVNLNRAFNRSISASPSGVHT